MPLLSLAVIAVHVNPDGTVLLIAITWSMDSGDSLGKSESYSEEQYRKQADRYPEPGIGLNHETERSTAEDVVPKAIEVLKGAGYRLVSVSDCLDLEPYEYVGGRSERDSSWTC